MNKASLISFLLITLSLYSCNKEVLIQQQEDIENVGSPSTSAEATSQTLQSTPNPDQQEIIDTQEVTIINVDKVYEINNAGLVNGRITDAQEGADLPLGGVEISFVKSDTSEVVFKTITNINGLYETPFLPADKYFLNIKKAGYISVVNVEFNIEVGKSKEANFHLSRFLNSDELRIVLSWKSSFPGVARDIDGRLYIEGEDKPVYYVNQKSRDLSLAVLDIDDQDFVGPETITIKKNQARSFSYVLNNYDPFSEVDGVRGEMGLSGIRVQVFDNNKMIKNYLVPRMKSDQALSGNWFNVFDLTVDEDGKASIEDRMIYSDEKKK